MYSQMNIFEDDFAEERTLKYDTIEEAEQVAIDRIRLAAEFSEYFYHSPILITYSGGKDSDVLLHLAQESGVEYEVIHSITTVDSPETNRHVNEVFERERARGVTCTKHIPTYKGEATNMWKLIVAKRMPPTRFVRYCCAVLKESTTPNRLICLGVRRAESTKRANRGVFEMWGIQQGYTMAHMVQAFQTALDESEFFGTDPNEENPSDCYMISTMKNKKDVLCNPIVDWSDNMVWEYIRKKNIKVNPMYAMGFSRVGCVGCPMSGQKKMAREFEMYPTYKRLYTQAFQKMIDKRKADGLEAKWKSGEECMDWWINGGIRHNSYAKQNERE